MSADADLEAMTRQIVELEIAWTQGLIDVDADRVRSFMTDDFSITTAGWLDTPADRETWLAHAFDRFRLDWFAFDDVRVRRYGGGDVLVAQMRCRQRGTDLTSGQPWAMVFRYTDVWVRHGDGWRIDIRQATGRPWADADEATFESLD